MTPAKTEWVDLIGPILFCAFLGWMLWARARRKPPPARANQVADEPEGTPYRVYTRDFDKVIRARDLPALASVVDKRRGRSRPRNIASGPARVAKSRTIAEAATERRQTAETELAACWRDVRPAIMLLIDHSGSIKDSIVSVAASVRWFAHVAERHDIPLGITGFTTVDWKGGESRERWVKDGRPARPGRLCDLLHIQYQDFGEPLADEDWQAMLEPMALRENIDGEAIEWAAGLLALRPEPLKLLIVVSDGAPVDDSTLIDNGPNFLVRHLRQVVAQIEEAGVVRLGAVGVEYRVHEYYRISTEASDLADLPLALASVIGKLIEDHA